MDQVHEQNNAYIKGVAGAAHLGNRTDESGLNRWDLCSNELAMIIQEFEDDLYNCDEDEEGHSNFTKKHHEDTPSFQNRYFEDVTKLYNNLTCNPFELCELTRIDDTSVIFDPVITGDIKLLAEKGEQQFETFWNDRLIYAKVAISDTVKKNNLHMTSDAAATSQPKDPTLTQAMVTKLSSQPN